MAKVFASTRLVGTPAHSPKFLLWLFAFETSVTMTLQWVRNKRNSANVSSQYVREVVLFCCHRFYQLDPTRKAVSFLCNEHIKEQACPWDSVFCYIQWRLLTVQFHGIPRKLVIRITLQHVRMQRLRLFEPWLKHP